jgi:hypothetical protein
VPPPPTATPTPTLATGTPLTSAGRASTTGDSGGTADRGAIGLVFIGLALLTVIIGFGLILRRRQ